ncbi:hypothetical protein B0I26_104183 [Anoxybacillus vitaminiphilus]|uniref:CN hydrolase domain-containing protein n=1 Tax=Paranoxybacillus vitaminiphilus TaxID=581036 RepID=A0A327YHP6_9BACL|nr:hypothetical protein B0I26_104183 [Anoxybacillus vitaminiphilus]
MTHYVKTAQEFEADFVLFPEFVTMQLMSIPNDKKQAQTIEDLLNFPAQQSRPSRIKK